MDALKHLNALPAAAARTAFLRCCGSTRWAQAMVDQRPFDSRAALLHTAGDIWRGLDGADYLEAFAQHPRIGRSDVPRAAPASTASWSAGEQAGVDRSGAALLDALTRANRDYEARFGYIFIVCATGKTGDEMLSLLRSRLPNEPDTELAVAAREQGKITRLRLEKLLDEYSPG